MSIRYFTGETDGTAYVYVRDTTLNYSGLKIRDDQTASFLIFKYLKLEDQLKMVKVDDRGALIKSFYDELKSMYKLTVDNIYTHTDSRGFKFTVGNDGLSSRHVGAD